jgi:hypothetical protein
MASNDEKLDQYYQLCEEAPEHIEVYLQNGVLSITDTSRIDESGLIPASKDIYQSDLQDFDLDDARFAIDRHSEPGPDYDSA